jgi:hypothetical protein
MAVAFTATVVESDLAVGLVAEVAFTMRGGESLSFSDVSGVTGGDWRAITEFAARQIGNTPYTFVGGKPIGDPRLWHIECVDGELVEFSIQHDFEDGCNREIAFRVPVGIASPVLMQVAQEVEAIQARAE